MIVTIKHSARLDKLHPENWKKSKRFKQNKFDPPLNRKIGEKVAKRAIHKLFETGFNKIKYIYSSPLTRCIQTALIIQKEIKKKFNQDIKIRIEYGLTELEIDKPIFKNDKFNYSNKNYLDSELELDNIIKNYGDYFDTSYKSIIDFSEIKLEISELPFYTRSIKVYQKIKSQIKNENTIICGDGIFMYVVYSYLTQKTDKSKFKEILSEYCSMVIDNPKRKNPQINLPI